ncbi:hypothetical protein A2Y99_02030 [Candidatus Gottesmanbacteria bacterium RBG_13_37_7]|uniref:Steroid 5-alpha reductase C-terminal domain-containing protein n=1 Tax=Candidatus Gottesmanbacteria bacterium RBG_13_37_7 TaxID=1798369 RepID=A0A1F5YHQ6_9BACT|nr:MAG: hypothetical protein A2Y99_02030 [Candidatus Gottesmanbacteria bacterium RBG_13_37_7]
MTLPWENIILAIISLIIFLVWQLTLPRLTLPFLKKYLSLSTLFRWSLDMLVVVQILQIIRISFPPTSFDIVFITCGLILSVVGADFAIYAKLIMHKNWGLPGQHDVKKQKQLVTSGPFGFSRNPIYVGLIMMFFGIELTLRSFLILLTIPLILYVRQTVKNEEQLLEKYFGQEYLHYKSRVPRFL